MGRIISQFSEQEFDDYSILRREAAQLRTQLSKPTLVTFLRNHEHSMRVMAFDNETNTEWRLELPQDDLFALADGKMALIEDPNWVELISIALKNLAIIEKDDREILTIEQKLFFTGEIIRPHSGESDMFIRKGRPMAALRETMETQTTFEYHILHEAFEQVYQSTKVLKGLAGDKTSYELGLTLERGSESGHVSMIVSHKSEGVDTSWRLVLINSEWSGHGLYAQSAKLGNEILMFSLEKLLDSDSLVLRVTTLCSQAFLQLYLYRKKHTGEYIELDEYQLYHYDTRSALFSSAFGYEQSFIDFGMLAHLKSAPPELPATQKQLLLRDVFPAAAH